MSESRDAMIAALRAVVLPVLRERGFKGSFPHFRRARNGRIDLMTFQFDRHGGGFIIEIAQCPPTGFTTSWGEHIEASKVTAWDLNDRSRLQPRQGSGTDSWFRFDTGRDYNQIAESVLPFLDKVEALFDAPGGPITSAADRPEEHPPGHTKPPFWFWAVLLGAWLICVCICFALLRQFTPLSRLTCVLSAVPLGVCLFYLCIRIAEER